MKSKILSLILTFVLLFVTMSVAFPAALAEGEANPDGTGTEEALDDSKLILNGDFKQITDGVPDNWMLTVQESSTVTVEENVEIAEGVTSNAIKFVSTANSTDSNKRNGLTYKKTVPIERNAKYTTTFWVKVKNVAGFRTYMFEPKFVEKDGSTAEQNTAQEGRNIYTFTYDNGSTRVIRTDISHTFKIAESGKIIDLAGPSMFITRSSGTLNILTPDYPAQDRQGEWVQVIHTFETGNNSAHEADISYDFRFNEAVDGEVWIADVQMSVEKSGIVDFYSPKINDATLGAISPGNDVAIYEGVETVLTAEPFGENKFDGWYNGDELVTKDATISFMYEEGVTPVYEARFTKAAFGIDGSYEGLADGLIATAPAGTVAEWTADGYKTNSTDGIHFVDSNNTGTWRKAYVSSDIAHTGTKSLKFYGMWGSVGRKFSGLNKNTNYVVTFYAQSTLTGGAADASINGITVTSADTSYIKMNNGALASKPVGDEGVLYYNANKHDTVGKWVKITVPFNTGDYNDVIVWVASASAGANLYIDNFAIARGNIEYTPTVNDSSLGFVDTVSTKDGEETTIVATPFGEAIFDGWYVDGSLVSKESKLTFTYDGANPPKYVANFSLDKDGIKIYEGYENGYTVNQILAQEVPTTVDTWTEESFRDSSKDGEHYYVSTFGDSWRQAKVTAEKAHTGTQSLRLGGQYGLFGKKISGLTKNTEYTLSFYAFLKYDQDEVDKPSIDSIMITDPNTSAVVLGNGKLGVRSMDNKGVICKESKNTEVVDNGWTKINVVFNSGDNEAVNLWLQPSGKNAVLYLDDFALGRNVDINVDFSRKGTTTKLPNAFVRNSLVSVTATPYEGNTFDGWYVDDELVSTDATYTFYATDMVLTPKFSGDNTPNYEYFETFGHDGTFEIGTIKDFYFADPQYSCSWCNATRSKDEAYEGEYSLRLFARHRNFIVPLTNLEAHTRYTLTFWYKLNDVDEKAYISTSGITTPDITDVSGGRPVIVKTDKVLTTGEWQKYEVSFNSGNNGTLNFVFRFATEKDIAIYVDNLEMTVGQYEDHAYDNACDADCNYCGETREVGDHVYDDDDDLICNECEHERAPLFTPGNINGDAENAVDLQDVVALAQIVAGWEDVVQVTEALDVDGNGNVDLQDVVLLAQYVAGWEVELSDTAYRPV